MVGKKAFQLSAVLLVMLAALVVQPLNVVAAPVSVVPREPAAQSDQQVACYTFPQTGQTVGGVFLTYWNAHGGVAQQGYPLTPEGAEVSDSNGQTYTVQYFERSVFEYHPENKAPNNVLLSLLGTFIYNQKYPDGAPNQVANKSADARRFTETNHWVGGGFLEYWNANGGLAQQGYPISDEFNEKSPLDGQTYRVQYFERAVFEYHPDNPAGQRIQLSQLGNFRLQAKHPSGFTTDQTVSLNCAPDSDGDGVADSVDQCPDQPENYNGVFDNDGCPDTIEDLVNSAATDINNFWTQTFAASDLRYEEPQAVTPYTTRIRTACGRAALNNAFFCPYDYAIYYDSNFFNDQLQTYGDFAPVLIIAHEWGHLVQDNLNILSAGYPTIYTELQADCFAGAWVRDVSNDTSSDNRPKLEEGDIQEGLASLYAAGDPADTPWFDRNAHGQPDQRLASFNGGLDSGVQYCLDEKVP